jgi:integrase
MRRREILTALAVQRMSKPGRHPDGGNLYLSIDKAGRTSRVRTRLQAVLDSATARGLRQRDNPARWKGHLETLLPARRHIDRTHFAALPYQSVPGFVVRLREQQSVGAAALEFTILTAAHTSETLGATWSEIDLDAGLLCISAKRMKGARPHRVPRSARAVEILRELYSHRCSGLVFPGQKPHRPMANMSMWQAAKRIDKRATTHGFRSAFRDWCGNMTLFPREVAEAALAHVARDAEQADRRQAARADGSLGPLLRDCACQECDCG